MFTIDNTLDTVKNGTLMLNDAIQSGKKQMINSLKDNEYVGKYVTTINNLVDAQTDYTSSTITNGFDAFKQYLNATSDYFQKSMKITRK